MTFTQPSKCLKCNGKMHCAVDSCELFFVVVVFLINSAGERSEDYFRCNIYIWKLFFFFLTHNIWSKDIIEEKRAILRLHI